MTKRLTTPDFIARAKQVHGDRYDYSESVYINNATKLKIICPEHGSFWQTPRDHCSKRGCYDCGRASVAAKRTIGFAEFRARASSTHGERYLYHEKDYSGFMEKTRITCAKHGDFYQKAISHTRGSGCIKCGFESSANSRKMSTEEFIQRCQEANGSKYTYEKVKDYKRNSQRVVVTCPKHGGFDILAIHHLAGVGCSKCRGHKLSTSEWIDKARKVHGDKYDYSKAEYASSYQCVTITCKDHGDFSQKPINHTTGRGCPLCPKKWDSQYYVYVMSSGSGSKIGITRDTRQRLMHLRRHTPFSIRLHSFIGAENYWHAMEIEKAAHDELADLNCGYKDFHGSTEWFMVAPDEAAKAVKRAAREMQEISQADAVA